MYELICGDCGDDPDLDYQQVCPEFQRIRGPYPIAAGVEAYEQHAGRHKTRQPIRAGQNAQMIAATSGPAQPWTLIGAGAATVVEAKLSSWESFLALFGFCVLGSASYLAMEIYAGFWPGQSQAFLARFRTWMETRTDQVIILGSLILGFWLIANSIYLIVT